MVAAQGVYAPQEDSRVLTDVLEKTGLAIGRRIADLCTGSGVVAITAAALGASAVTAFDICPRAVRCARVNAVCAGVDVDVHLESWARAVESRRSTSSSAIRRTCRMIRASTMRCRLRSDRRAHGTPDTTSDWCSIRSARPCPTCWRTAAACGSCSPNSPTRGAPLPRSPAPDWTPKWSHGNVFRSGRC